MNFAEMTTDSYLDEVMYDELDRRTADQFADYIHGLGSVAKESKAKEYRVSTNEYENFLEEVLKRMRISEAREKVLEEEEEERVEAMNNIKAIVAERRNQAE